jgi:hypothetical protein
LSILGVAAPESESSGSVFVSDVIFALSPSPPIIMAATLDEQHTIIPTAAAIIGADIFVF